MDAVRDAERIGAVEPVDRRPDGRRSGADDELVVLDRFLAAARVPDVQLAALDVDAARGRVQAQSHAGRLERRDVAVSEVAPVRHVAGDVVGDPADREVRIGVSEHDLDVAFAVELANAEGGADAGVASSHDDDPAQTSSFSRASRSAGAGPTVDGAEGSLLMSWYVSAARLAPAMGATM